MSLGPLLNGDIRIGEKDRGCQGRGEKVGRDEKNRMGKRRDGSEKEEIRV